MVCSREDTAHSLAFRVTTGDLVKNLRWGLKYGDARLIDAMINDGLWDVGIEAFQPLDEFWGGRFSPKPGPS